MNDSPVPDLGPVAGELRDYEVSFHYIVAATSPDDALNDAPASNWILEYSQVRLVHDDALDGEAPDTVAEALNRLVAVLVAAKACEPQRCEYRDTGAPPARRWCFTCTEWDYPPGPGDPKSIPCTRRAVRELAAAVKSYEDLEVC